MIQLTVWLCTLCASTIPAKTKPHGTGMLCIGVILLQQ